MIEVTGRGGVVGFAADGKEIIVERMRGVQHCPTAWRVSIAGDSAMLDPRGARFTSKRAACRYAATLYDAAKTEALRWWD